MLYVYTTLQEVHQEMAYHKTDAAMDSPAESSSRQADLAEPTKNVRLKSALLWSHHLLATSKRKDIQHWAVELEVWAIAKLG